MSVRIVGGGLSGLSAAIQLARHGVGVEVFERRSNLKIAPEIRCDAVENWTTADDFSAVLSNWAIDTSPFHQVSSIDVLTFDGECHRLAQLRPMLYLVKRGGESGASSSARRSSRSGHYASIPGSPCGRCWLFTPSLRRWRRSLR